MVDIREIGKVCANAQLIRELNQTKKKQKKREGVRFEQNLAEIGKVTSLPSIVRFLVPKGPVTTVKFTPLVTESGVNFPIMTNPNSFNFAPIFL